MTLSNSCKLMLGVAAIAATTAFVPAASAQSTDTCAKYASRAAYDSVPGRGPIVGLIALPFEVTGALLTGRTSNNWEWKRAYDAAYTDCMNGHMAMDGPPMSHNAMAMNDYCAAKYRSYNPATGTYVTYGGEVRACR